MCSCLYHIVVLCSIWIASSYGSLTLKMLKDRNVIITGPQNVDVFLRSSDKIIVAWTLPEVYVPHDTSDQAFKKLVNGEIGILKPMFSLKPHEVEQLKNGNISDTNSTAMPTNATVTKSDKDSNATEEITPTASTAKASTAPVSPQDQDANADTGTNTTASSQAPTLTDKPTEADDKVATPSPTSSARVKRASTPLHHLNRIICRGLEEFADYTVSEKEPGLMENGWAVSLLDSNLDIPATNMSLFYSEDEHKLVKFEKGCVTRLVVSYHRRGYEHDAKMINLNATDHLATIDDLKPGVEYKIVVTAHFVSGDFIAAPPIYVTTLLTGVICKCDWHGTQNHTSDCDIPSITEQHCGCNDGYAGRFCQDCAAGHYRDSLGDGCKKCPCGEHGGIVSSCQFHEGFLKCDQCAVGYVGNVCHKCDNGYFRYKNVCRECVCNNNTLPGSPNVCSPTTGMCNNCLHNTTGFYCERCLPKYRRVPGRHTGKCYAISEVGSVGDLTIRRKSPSSGVSSGVIGAIVFVCVLCVCVVVGLCIVRRVRANRQRRALWTVEMRPDNDDLDFNSVHNEDARMDQIDDMAFYDRQTGRSKTGGKYHKLDEEC